eukprot:1157935-Pelagomonas_calceolata.AAC.27
MGDPDEECHCIFTWPVNTAWLAFGACRLKVSLMLLRTFRASGRPALCEWKARTKKCRRCLSCYWVSPGLQEGQHSANGKEE